MLILSANVIYIDEKVKVQSFAQTSTSASDFKTYEESNYGISIQYPFDWISIQNSSAITFVSPSGTSVGLLILNLSGLNILSSDYVDGYINSLRDTLTDFRLLESNSTVLAGNLGHKLLFTDRVGPKVYYSIEIWTTKGDKEYSIRYIAEEGDYSRYLPIAQKVIDSFEIR